MPWVVQRLNFECYSGSTPFIPIAGLDMSQLGIKTPLYDSKILGPLRYLASFFDIPKASTLIQVLSFAQLVCVLARLLRAT